MVGGAGALSWRRGQKVQSHLKIRYSSHALSALDAVCSGTRPRAILPGNTREEVYGLTVPTSIWGPYLERNIRIATDRVACELDFPAAQVESLEVV
jgi:hypothetical protein